MPASTTLGHGSNATQVQRFKHPDSIVKISREDSVHLDVLYRIAYQMAETSGKLILMAPNANLATLLKVCIENAEDNHLFAYARERILGIYYDVQQMTQAIAVHRQTAQNSDLIVVRFISTFEVSMKWSEFHLDKTSMPVAFVGNGVIGHDSSGNSDFETSLHKRSTVGGLPLSTWNFTNPKYRGIGCYGLGFHQSAAQTVVDYAWDAGKLVAFVVALPVLLAVEGVNRALWGKNAAAEHIGDLKARVIANTDVLHILSVPVQSDFRTSSFRSGPTSGPPSYRTFDQLSGGKAPSAYIHSNSSSYNPDRPRRRERIQSDIESVRSDETFRPRPFQPAPVPDLAEANDKKRGKVRKFFRSLVVRNENPPPILVH